MTETDGVPYFLKMESTALAFEWFADMCEEMKDSDKVVMSTRQIRKFASNIRDNILEGGDDLSAPTITCSSRSQSSAQFR